MSVPYKLAWSQPGPLPKCAAEGTQLGVAQAQGHFRGRHAALDEVNGSKLTAYGQYEVLKSQPTRMQLTFQRPARQVAGRRDRIQITRATGQQPFDLVTHGGDDIRVVTLRSFLARDLGGQQAVQSIVAPRHRGLEKALRKDDPVGFLLETHGRPENPLMRQAGA